MIKFKLDLTLEEQETRGGKSGVLVTGPVKVNGTGVKPAEVIAIAEALSVAIGKLMPQIEALPGRQGPLVFAEALNRSLMEWAKKR